MRLRVDETECLADGCLNEIYDDTADTRIGYPWPWNDPYPYDPEYNPSQDRRKTIIRADPRYGSVKPRIYEAALSARKNEQIRFHIKFSKGSHMKLYWMLNSDEVIPPPRILPTYAHANLTNSYPHVKLENERCEITAAPPDAGVTQATVEEQTYTKPDGAKTLTTFVSAMSGTAADLCSFPFRYESVLYYACTYIDTIGASPVHLCATETDEDFNPITIGFCNTDLRCPIQLPRPEEVGLSNKEEEVQIVTEGQTVFNRTYIQAVETEIILDRKFSVAGHTYNLTMVSYNMHDITSPNIVMKWRVICENPVKPEDWSLEYNREGIHFGEAFEVRFQIAPGADLPTRPKISVYAVTSLAGDGSVLSMPGQPVVHATAMRRWDHAPFISHQTPEYIIPFYVKGEIDSDTPGAAKARAQWNNNNRARQNWWEPLRSADNMAQTPPELLMHDEYELSHLGVENSDEWLGVVPHDGSSSNTNLKSPDSGDPQRLGSGVGPADYTGFTLVFPTIKYPGSYAFTVAMWNGISNIRYTADRNLSHPVYYSENITLLLPGGEGYTHGSGKADDYCIQFKNGSRILDSQGQELCQSGSSLELEVDPGSYAATIFPWTPQNEVNFNGSYKWMLNWVEIFERLEGPYEATLKFVFPIEFPNDKVTERGTQLSPFFRSGSSPFSAF